MSTIPSPKPQSAANNAAPENVSPTIRTTAALSTEKPVNLTWNNGKFNLQHTYC